MLANAERLAPHTDRLFPVDPGVRTLARRLYETVRDLPIISPHGHIDPQMLLDDRPFENPVSLFVTPDHYVTRLLHASGVPLADLGVGTGPLSEQRAREAWRQFCSHWDVFAGTPVRYWLESELAEIFGVESVPSAGNADAIYDQIAACLARAEFRPQALFRQFGIEVLATTDDPTSDLSAHAALAAQPAVPGRVIPTFRPDRYVHLQAAGWRDAVASLGAAAGEDTGSYQGFIRALESRRRYFLAHGAVSVDHAHIDARTDPLTPEQAGDIYRSALSGEVTRSQADAFRRNMLLEMARMSCDDGLVMTIHPGSLRDYHGPLARAYGPDQGHDIPLATEYTRALRPLLERYGMHPNLHLVIFTLDETVWSRELAPLAGFYPSVYVGAPWWFLDAPDAIQRFRAAVTETTGFTRTSGFIDDTRAFCSVPARHDMSRRLDCGYLAGLVAQHRLGEQEAAAIAVDLVAQAPRRVFKL